MLTNVMVFVAGCHNGLVPAFGFVGNADHDEPTMGADGLPGIIHRLLEFFTE